MPIYTLINKKNLKKIEVHMRCSAVSLVQAILFVDCHQIHRKHPSPHPDETAPLFRTKYVILEPNYIETASLKKTTFLRILLKRLQKFL